MVLISYSPGLQYLPPQNVESDPYFPGGSDNWNYACHVSSMLPDTDDTLREVTPDACGQIWRNARALVALLCCLPWGSPACKLEGSLGPRSHQGQVQQKPLSLALWLCPTLPLSSQALPLISSQCSVSGKATSWAVRPLVSRCLWGSSMTCLSPGARTYMSCFRPPALPKLYLVFCAWKSFENNNEFSQWNIH